MDDVDDGDDEIEDSDWEVDWSLGVATSQDALLCPQVSSTPPCNASETSCNACL